MGLAFNGDDGARVHHRARCRGASDGANARALQNANGGGGAADTRGKGNTVGNDTRDLAARDSSKAPGQDDRGGSIGSSRRTKDTPDSGFPNRPD